MARGRRRGTAHAGRQLLLSGQQVVVDALDNIPARLLLERTAVELDLSSGAWTVFPL